ALVENDLELETQVPNGGKDRRFVGLPRRENDAAHRDTADAALAQCADEGIRRTRREGRFLAGRGLVEKSAVLGDDVLEQVEPRANLLQLVELAPGHEHEAPA